MIRFPYIDFVCNALNFKYKHIYNALIDPISKSNLKFFRSILTSDGAE